MILISGFDPLKVFGVMIQGALGTEAGQSYVLTYAATLILSGLAFMIPGKAGIWNVGAQGQIYFGGICAALVALFVPLPFFIWPIMAFLFGSAVGALWAFIPGVLETYRKASAIVTTILLNYVAQAMSSFILFNYVGRRLPQTLVANQTPLFSNLVTLPRIPGSSASTMIFISVLVAVLAWYFLYRTTLGYKIRAVGSSPMPAEAKGIDPRTMRIVAMAIGGLVAGLAGAGDILSRGSYVDQFPEGYFGGEGFAGIAVALVAANNPIAAIAAAFFFAVMVAGTPFMGAEGLPRELVWAIQGLIILFTAMPYLSQLVLKRAGRRMVWP